jgi:hypothetical protein
LCKWKWRSWKILIRKAKKLRWDIIECCLLGSTISGANSFSVRWWSRAHSISKQANAYLLRQRAGWTLHESDTGPTERTWQDHVGSTTSSRTTQKKKPIPVISRHNIF